MSDFRLVKSRWTQLDPKVELDKVSSRVSSSWVQKLEPAGKQPGNPGQEPSTLLTRPHGLVIKVGLVTQIYVYILHKKLQFDFFDNKKTLTFLTTK
jgi:hypothetical protein